MSSKSKKNSPPPASSTGKKPVIAQATIKAPSVTKPTVTPEEPTAELENDQSGSFALEVDKQSGSSTLKVDENPKKQKWTREEHQRRKAQFQWSLPNYSTSTGIHGKHWCTDHYRRRQNK